MKKNNFAIQLCRFQKKLGRIRVNAQKREKFKMFSLFFDDAKR
jgi:hypothetical protein